MHDEIIRFHLDGTMSDINIVEQRERLIHNLEIQMRDHGVVPALDLGPQFTLDYLPESETYNFSLTVYGVWTENVNGISGFCEGKAVPRVRTKKDNRAVS
jgi:hypothetical protein